MPDAIDSHAARTTFVGRAEELAALRRAVARSPLVTVVGPGGAGKTRLVREWLRQEDAIFCDLSDMQSTDGMVVGLANALSLPQVNEAVLLRALKDRGPTTIVLDNLEQLLPHGATVLDQWLDVGPHLRFVATSRCPTHLSGEHLVEVPPLGLPTDSVVQEADACALFMDRARALSPDLSPTAEEWQSIAEIVTRLDGLPLAIELAASRVRVLTVSQIADQLGDKLDVMATKNPLTPARHATLRGAVAWSWNLLSDEEQAATTHLSAFRGQFDLDGAAAVIGVDWPLEILHTLRDHALLVVDDTYRLFECVRDFAREHLAASDDREAVQARHDDFFERLAERGDADQIMRSVGDLVDVHDRALHASNGDRALRIALALEPLLLGRGPAKLLARLLDGALAQAPDAPLSGRGHLARGHALADMGRFEESQRAREHALEIARERGDRSLTAKALASLGRHAWHVGRTADAVQLSNEAIAIYEELDDEEAVAETVSHRANFRWLQGHIEEARKDYLLALAVLERHDDRRAEAIALGNLATLERDMGALSDARAHFERALELLTKIGDRFHRGTFGINLASLLLETGEVEKARAALDESLALHREAGNRRWEGMAQSSLALCDELQGDSSGALQRHIQATELAERFGHPVMLAMVLCARARATADLGDVAEAEAVVGRARGIFEEVGETVVSELADAAEGHVELAKLRAGSDAAHGERARAIADRLHANGASERSGELRAALSRLRAALSALVTEEGLLVREAALQFCPPGGGWQDISTRGALHRILNALCEQRDKAPGDPLTRADLIAAGWPGERITTEAAAGRVYTAIASLRRKGLRDVLLRRDDGYLLDPDVPLYWQ